MILETERLVLRVPLLEDIDIIHDILSSREQTRFLPGGKPYTADQQSSYLSERIAHWAEHGFGTYIICKKDDHFMKLGYAGIEYSPIQDYIEIRYGLARRFEKQGYITEACQAILKWVESNTEISRIYGAAVSANQASINILKKLGMKDDKTVGFYAENDLKYFSVITENPD